MLNFYASCFDPDSDTTEASISSFKLPLKTGDLHEGVPISKFFVEGVLLFAANQCESFGFVQGSNEQQFVASWRLPNQSGTYYGVLDFKTGRYRTNAKNNFARQGFGLLGMGAAFASKSPTFRAAWMNFLTQLSENYLNYLKDETMGWLAAEAAIGLTRAAPDQDTKRWILDEDPASTTVPPVDDLRHHFVTPEDFLSLADSFDSPPEYETRFQGPQLKVVRNMLRRRKHTILLGPPGVGKALAIDTPIPTPSGWTTMGELRLGDTVFDEKGEPCVVTFATEVQHGRPCYEVEFSDGSVLVADAEHRWLTRTREDRVQGRAGVVKTTSELLKTLTVERGARANHSIPVAQPLHLVEADLPVDPYVLGAWLGDGCSRVAQVTSADEEVVSAIASAGYPVKALQNSTSGKAKLYSIGAQTVMSHTISRGRRTKRHWGEHREYRPGNGLSTKLKQLGLLRNKHIPTAYLRASVPQRLALLQGLMDTDGYVCPLRKSLVEFTNTTAQLAHDVFELVVSLGMKPTISQGAATLYGRVIGPKWRIVFRPTKQVFRLGRKAKPLADSLDSVRPTVRERYIKDIRSIASVPVRCIQVSAPSHLFLAGRTMIPTHNTLSVFEALSLEGFTKAGEDYQLFSGHDEVKSADFLGSWQPNGEPGHYVWVNGCLVRAMTANGGQGQPILVEEFTRMPTRAQNMFISALSDGYVVLNEKPTANGEGEVVRAGPNFVLLADMNVDPSADDIELYGAAFSSRVRKVEYDYPSVAGLLLILAHDVPDSTQPMRTGISGTYDAVMKRWQAAELSQPISPRACVQWAEEIVALTESNGRSDSTLMRGAAWEGATLTWLRDVAGTDVKLRKTLMADVEAQFRKAFQSSRGKSA